MPGIGPMVYRSAHVGAALVALGSTQFVLAMAWSQLLYPGYSLRNNDISDLGCCGSAEHALIFNLSIRLLGISVIVGAFLLRAAFPSKTSARLGLGSMMIAGASAVGVGLFPEDSTVFGGHLHSAVAASTFLFAGLSLIFLTLAMLRDTRWGGFRSYTFFSGLISLVAIALYQSGTTFGLGLGGMERVIVAPPLLWLVLAGVHVLRIPRYRALPPEGYATG